MAEFREFGKAVTDRVNHISKRELYVVDVDKESIWEHYLKSFPEGTNPIFRERAEHDCSCCRHFIKNYGRVVAIFDGAVETVWSVSALHPYDAVAKAMDEYVRQFPIVDVFRSRELQYGAEFTRELRDGETHRWYHFHGQVNAPHRADNPAKVRSIVRAKFDVFKRGLETLKVDALDEIADLISGNHLYRGAEHKDAVNGFRKLLRDYDGTDIYCWQNCSQQFAQFRNTVIGTLAIDLSDDVPLEAAVKSFEQKVAPQNYKRPTALITPKMIDQAFSKLNELGLGQSIERRVSRLSDINVNDVLWVDNSVRAVMVGGNLAQLQDQMLQQANKKPRTSSNADSVGIEDFLNKILPDATAIEILVENRMLPNFMTLTSAVHDDAKPIFKWGTNNAWSYDGNVTDSIRERVKRAGGQVENVFMRASLSWSNTDDLDLHCMTPSGHIYYGHRQSSGGTLDVDMNVSNLVRDPVENIRWPIKPPDGLYKFSVNQYTKRESIDVGFEVEFEHGNELQNFSYPKAVRSRETVSVFEVVLQKGQIVDFKTYPGIEGGSMPREKWGITTQEFVPVNALMRSPNHQTERRGGNLHYFFILDGCANPEPTRGIYNEFLTGELEQHRKVFEVLGDKAKCPVDGEGLSGLGFSSTRKDKLTVRVNKTRIFEIEF